MKNQRIYIEKKQVPDINGIFPRGFFYGDGVFETMRWKKSSPVFLQKHIERITHGALILKMPAPDGKKIVEEINECVEKSGFSDCAVKVCLVSGGSFAPFFSVPDDFQTVISISEITDNPADISLKIVFNGYSRSSSPVAGIKSLNYLGNVVAMREARESGFDDALFSSADGCVSETTCRNIFWGEKNELFTPSTDCGILPGITRGVLMDIAARNGFSVSESRLNPGDLAQAGFVFATNSVSGITPVEKISLQDLTLNFSTSVDNSYKQLTALLLKAFQW
ncbi:MAG: hypothetical protein GKS04_00930 [Candidatus Mycalebacterium zealandia]|nr:MAG: hypothetical protein GKS04_00930 [Candidatus Mycalebacterium zealandia]